MKRLSLLFFGLLFAAAVSGQTVKRRAEPGISFSITRSSDADSLAGKPYRLKRGDNLNNSYWRFKAGDSLAWANPVYQDRHWNGLTSPDDAILENKALWTAGKGWYRLLFQPKASAVGKPLNLFIEQFGRSELYLDGRLLATLKPPRIDSGGSQRYVQVVAFPVNDTNRHVLAIRYAFRKEPVYFARLGENPMRITVDRTDKALTTYQLSEAFGVGLDFIMVGIFGTLSLLHFLFFRVNRLQRINRTLCWTMLAFALIFLTDYLTDVTPTLALDSVVELVGSVAGRVGCALLLWGVYQYLNLRAGWFFRVILTLLAADVMFRFAYWPSGESMLDYIGTAAFTLVFVDYVRLSWIGRQRKEADSRLPWRSLKTSLLCVAGTLVVIIIGVFLSRSYTVGFDMNIVLAPVFALLFIALLSIPVGLSLSLVQDYARTYKSLNTKLQEVEQLSTQTVAQEQEKQALLARQNETLERQVADRTAALDQSLTELRATQDQLVQREKLASLGELTAGVAHEIQNPLNFVNNFSEVSAELVGELEEEQQKPDRDTQLEAELLGDLKQNLRKITHHGGRASAIVRGMLEHARTGTGQREATDLNALSEEYLKIAYHGLRAKDKDFNADLVTDFDADLPKVAVMPQEMGRVLLNLFNNAFYAVQQKQPTAPVGYKPVVRVSTRRTEAGVEIRVSDNGTGMSDAVKAKVFQPFFTTKPTGSGTGLGLSLSYDIVTKGHDGTISVRSEPGAGAEFTVTLPL